VSISKTFYEQLLHQYFYVKKLQCQTVSREKLLYEKATCKILVKLTNVSESLKLAWPLSQQ